MIFVNVVLPFLFDVMIYSVCFVSCIFMCQSEYHNTTAYHREFHILILFREKSGNFVSEIEWEPRGCLGYLPQEVYLHTWCTYSLVGVGVRAPGLTSF